MIALSQPKPPLWQLSLALSLVYLSWGTTPLAIKEGVKTLPPCLFAGTRIASAGVILAAFMAWSGRPIRLSGREVFQTWLLSLLLFVGGNGLMTYGQKTVPSGRATVLIATVPLWMGLLETLWPRGERLALLGWGGLLLGLLGLVILCSDQWRDPTTLLNDPGTFFVLGSALCWAAGSVVLRHRRVHGDRLTMACYQMLLGGATLMLFGLASGEARGLDLSHLSPKAVVAFLYLLFVGSLVGFLSYSWLLVHVSTAVAGTYAYVTPAIALLVGWSIGGEFLTGSMVAGMVVILAGVALVRSGEAAWTGGAATSPDESAGCPPLGDEISTVPEKV